jgi:hypothetical protein
MKTSMRTTHFAIRPFLSGFSLVEKRTSFAHVLGSQTRVESVTISGKRYARFVNEFWTARQRQACSLHEVAWRAQSIHSWRGKYAQPQRIVQGVDGRAIGGEMRLALAAA